MYDTYASNKYKAVTVRKGILFQVNQTEQFAFCEITFKSSFLQ